jgi:hypothetical protein
VPGPFIGTGASLHRVPTSNNDGPTFLETGCTDAAFVHLVHFILHDKPVLVYDSNQPRFQVIARHAQHGKALHLGASHA